MLWIVDFIYPPASYDFSKLWLLLLYVLLIYFKIKKVPLKYWYWHYCNIALIKVTVYFVDHNLNLGVCLCENIASKVNMQLSWIVMYGQKECVDSIQTISHSPNQSANLAISAVTHPPLTGGKQGNDMGGIMVLRSVC